MSDAYINPERLEEGELLGQGGFGQVFTGLLRDERGQRKVALKCPKPGVPKLQETLFVKEVIDTIQISRKCPNVIQCFGFSAMRSGAACMVMDLYTTSLHELLSDSRDDPLPAAQRARIAADIVEGVWQLHSMCGLLVEDIKPANVLLDGNKRAYLADFGSTKSLSPDVSAMTTRDTTYSCCYVPPEKLRRGGDKFRLSRASDVWSLGITLLQLCCCDVGLPFPGMDTGNIAVQLFVDKEMPEVPAMPELPGMQQLIQRCLQLEPKERITTEELRRGVQGVLSQVSSSTRASSKAGRVSSTQADSRNSSALQARLEEAEREKAELRKQLEGLRVGTGGRDAPGPGALANPPAQGAQTLRSRSLPDLAAALDAARRQRKASVIDLCGLELKGSLGSDLLVPDQCTVRDGSIQLPESAKVTLQGNTCLDGLVISGAGNSDYALEVASSSCVCLQECTVDGGGEDFGCAAVAVKGRGSKLVASDSSMHCSKGDGLCVYKGGHAVLEKGCRADGNGGYGWVVRGKDSHLSVRDSSASGNGGSNAYVACGATADIVQCFLDGSEGRGLAVWNEGTLVTASDTSFCGNSYNNVYAWDYSTLKLSGCRCDGSKKAYGWCAWNGATITVDAASTANANAEGSINEYLGGRIVRA